jgi:flagellar protein FlgJ
MASQNTNVSNDLSRKFALDVKDMGSLRQGARAGTSEALKGAATQFEAMFVNMMMKSMRDASPQDGLTNSEQTKMLNGMLDQQTSQNIAKKGIGLSDMLVRQLSKNDNQALAVGGAGDAADGANAGSFAGMASLMDAKLQKAIAAAGGNAKTDATTTATGTAAATTATASPTRRGSQAPHVVIFQ